VVSEPVAGRGSIAVRYRHWNRDRTIDYALMAGNSSPPPDGDSKVVGKGDGSSGTKDETVIKRVVREVGGGTSYPVLTQTNYSDRTCLMKVKLKVRALWRAIDVGGVDQQEEMMALDALCSAVPPEIATVIAEKDTVKEVWDAIATVLLATTA
jgi:hypothetical protein